MRTPDHESTQEWHYFHYVDGWEGAARLIQEALAAGYQLNQPSCVDISEENDGRFNVGLLKGWTDESGVNGQGRHS